MSDKHTLTVMQDPSNRDFYIAAYTGDEGNEAHGLAYQGTIADAIEEALNVWGLMQDEVNIET